MCFIQFRPGQSVSRLKGLYQYWSWAKAEGREWRKGMQEEHKHNLPLSKPRRTALFFPSLTPKQVSLRLLPSPILSTPSTTFTTTSIPTSNSRSLFPATLHRRIRSSFHPVTLFTRLDTHTGRHTFHAEPLERYHCETQLLVID